MRLWSIHPKYLDQKGLIALWREGLLVKCVLENKTKGYKNHPQLERFKRSSKPFMYINLYLHYVCDEADNRGYSFNRLKLKRRIEKIDKIFVKNGQVKYEWIHLLNKLENRSTEDFERNKSIIKPDVNPIFRRVWGGIEAWELIK